MKHDKEKEKALIERYKAGDEGAASELIYLYEPTATAKARSFAKDKQWGVDKRRVEDVQGEIFKKFFDYVKRNLIKGSPYALFRSVADSVCTDDYWKERKKRTVEISDYVVDEKRGTLYTELAPDLGAVAPGSKEYTGVSEEWAIKQWYAQKLPSSVQEGINLCLDYIEEFYRVKNRISLSDIKYHPDEQIRNVLLKTKKQLKRVLGPKIEERISRYNELIGRDKNSLDDSEKQELAEMSLISHRFPYITDINKLIKRSGADREFWNLGRYVSYYPTLLYEDFYENIPKYKIESPKLFIDVLSNVKELKSRQMGDSFKKRLKIILEYMKLTTKDTDKEFLFEDLADFDASIRKYVSPSRSPRNPFHNTLVKYIYERSFIDRVSIKKPFHLNLLAMRDKKVTGDTIDNALMRLPISAIPECLHERWQQLNNEKRNRKKA